MPTLVKGKTFTSNEQVTSTKLHQLVDSATFDPGAVDNVGIALTGGVLGVKSGYVEGLIAATPYGVKNRIINGRMNVAQRGTTFASPSTGAYTLDRWRVDHSQDGTFTIIQSSDVPASLEFQNSLRLTVNTADASIAAGQFCVISQPIEGWNIRDLIGRTFTLSFWVRSAKTGVHCVSFRNSANDRSYVLEYGISSANTWEKKTLTVTNGLTTGGTWVYTNGIGLSVAFCLATGATYQTTVGAWNTGNFLGTSNQVNALDTNGNIFAITGVQLELGSAATPFEHRNISAELSLCQRYYEISGYAIPTSGSVFAGYWKAEKRAAPSFNWTPAVGSGGSVRTLTGATTSAFIAASYATVGAEGTLIGDSEL